MINSYELEFVSIFCLGLIKYSLKILSPNLNLDSNRDVVFKIGLKFSVSSTISCADLY